MIKFSILVLLYNSDPRKVLMTLESVLRQDMKEIELIISDDGSAKDPSGFIEDYLNKRHFTDYLIIRNEENLGTVRNLYGALLKAKGQYIKAIGAGDMLYGKSTLNEVYDYMSANNITSCFGRMISYSMTSGNKVTFKAFQAPKYIDQYIKKRINRRILLKDMLLHDNWISGATMFFKREELLKYMKHLQGRVKYVEDVFQFMIFLRKDYMRFFDRHLIWYEVGTGITTSIHNKLVTTIKKDQEAFVYYVASRYKGDRKWLMSIITRWKDQRAGLKKNIIRDYIEDRRWKLCLWKEKMNNKHVKETSDGFLCTNRQSLNKVIHYCDSLPGINEG